MDGSELARAFFTFAALVGAAMCSAFRCGSHDRVPRFNSGRGLQYLAHLPPPIESTLSPQARRNLPSALRNPLDPSAGASGIPRLPTASTSPPGRCRSARQLPYRKLASAQAAGQAQRIIASRCGRRAHSSPHQRVDLPAAQLAARRCSSTATQRMVISLARARAQAVDHSLSTSAWVIPGASVSANTFCCQRRDH